MSLIHPINTNLAKIRNSGQNLITATRPYNWSSFRNFSSTEINNRPNSTPRTAFARTSSFPSDNQEKKTGG